jgi:beta-glucosidase-like glycosyl hydrolase
MGNRAKAVAAVVTGVVLCSLVAGARAPAEAAVPPTTLTPAQEVFARMTEAQRVGQLLMVGTPATSVSSATVSAIANQHVGSVILTGRSTSGVTATRSVTSSLKAQATTAATAGVSLVIAADQEGGNVQVLKGTGFSTMPTALTQGTWSPSTLTSAATTWARQLASAGVNVNLAPVADTVPSAAFAPSNAPIGAYQREFGYDTTTVSSHAAAFSQGMRAGGVMVSAKHFLGLGRVTANTDTTSGVKDGTTTRTDPYLAPFRASVGAGSEFLMVSSAIYTRIDSANPAVFSKTVIDGMIRGDRDYRGVVVSDDLGNARQVAAWTPGARAVKFIAAGGDMVLTVNPSQAPEMASAIRSQMAASATFRSQVNAAALRVLTVKQRMGGLQPNGAVRATDVDEDGGADIVGRLTGGQLDLFRGNDRGGLRPTELMGNGNFDFANLIVAAGDLNGDKHADVLARRASDGALLLFPGTGRGQLYNASVIGTGWGGMTALVAPGDFDGDGHPDVLARTTAGELLLYRGNGVGGWLAGGPVSLGTGWNGFDRILAVGDFDRDYTPDLVARSAKSGDLQLYRGNGVGGFTGHTRIGTGWSGMDSILGPGDFDGDGLCDVLARSAITKELYLYRGTKTGLRAGTAVSNFSGVTLFG